MYFSFDLHQTFRVFFTKTNYLDVLESVFVQVEAKSLVSRNTLLLRRKHRPRNGMGRPSANLAHLGPIQTHHFWGPSYGAGCVPLAALPHCIGPPGKNLWKKKHLLKKKFRKFLSKTCILRNPRERSFFYILNLHLGATKNRIFLNFSNWHLRTPDERMEVF